ncbi:glutaredoxin 3 [Thermodesulfobacteriota bacterium]
MKEVFIYTTVACPYCIKAKSLLDQKGVEYHELRVDENPELAVKAREKSGGMRTLPQIFINDYHVGGCDELYALNTENKLDALFED